MTDKYAEITVQAGWTQDISVNCECGWVYDAEPDSMDGWPKLDQLTSKIDKHHEDGTHDR